VAATIGAVTTVASTVLPSVLGGDTGAKAEAAAGLEQLQTRLQNDISQVQRESQDWSRQEAEQRLDRNGQIARDSAFTRYFNITSGADHPAAEQLASQAAEGLRTAVLQAAEERRARILLQENAIGILGLSAATIGGGLLLWRWATRDDGDEGTEGDAA
jgi:hypothetical protein